MEYISLVSGILKVFISIDININIHVRRKLKKNITLLLCVICGYEIAGTWVRNGMVLGTKWYACSWNKPPHLHYIHIAVYALRYLG